jgi:hypothetical protein
MREAKIYSETNDMAKNQKSRFKIRLLAGVLASSLLVLPAGAKSPAQAGTTAQAGKPSAAAGAPHTETSQFEWQIELARITDSSGELNP